MKTYLGDGAYAEFDGYSIILTAENGIRATDTVVLEPPVYAELERFVAGLRALPPTPRRDTDPAGTENNPENKSRDE